MIGELSNYEHRVQGPRRSHAAADPADAEGAADGRRRDRGPFPDRQVHALGPLRRAARGRAGGLGEERQDRHLLAQRHGAGGGAARLRQRPRPQRQARPRRGGNRRADIQAGRKDKPMTDITSIDLVRFFERYDARNRLIFVAALSASLVMSAVVFAHGPNLGLGAARAATTWWFGIVFAPLFIVGWWTFGELVA